jgi:glycosyltransferase involved in cell wall biosynthesis
MARANVGIYKKRKIYKIEQYLLKSPSFIHTDDDTFLQRYTRSEWTEYELWLFRNRLFTLNGLKTLYKRARAFKIKPKISILMPVFNPDPSEFFQAIESVLWQAYPYWELCIVDDMSDSRDYLKLLGRLRDKRIKVFLKDFRGGIAETSQYALQSATGDYVVPLDQDDELFPDTLFSFVDLLQDREIDYFYSDRDMISPHGKRYMHFFKPGWSPEYLLSFNYLPHVEIYNTKLVLDAGGFRKDYEGSQDYDLALRVTEKTNRIEHFPMILYSWRQSPKSISTNHEAKSYIYDAGVRALKDTAKRRDLPIKDILEDPTLWRGHYKIVWDERFLNEKKICLVIVGNKKKDSNRLKKLFEDMTPRLNVHFITTDADVTHINTALKKIKQDEYVFFCDDSVAEVVSPAFYDMLGYLSIDGVCAVGCKLLDDSNRIFSVGLSMSTSGTLIYNYRGSPLSEHGYGAAASVPRNVSLLYPAFWGAKMSVIKEKGYLKGAERFFQASLQFFTSLMRAHQRIVCVPFMCLRVDTKKIENRDTAHNVSETWMHAGLTDRYYNPNLTDNFEDFGVKI